MVQPAYQYIYTPPEGQPATNVERKEHTVSITDLRSVPQDFTLENNGFQLHRLQIPDDIDWDDEQQVLPCLTSTIRMERVARACLWTQYSVS